MNDKAAAGWYPDSETGGMRWWDGENWTEARQPAPLASPQQVYGSTDGPPGIQPQLAVPPLVLPAGVTLASPGRRIGAYFLALPLFVVTLGFGYLIWGLIAWGRGTSPALQSLDMKAYRPVQQSRATFGNMATRNVLDVLIAFASCGIAPLVSFIMFLTDDRHRTIADRVGGTVIVHDPTNALG